MNAKQLRNSILQEAISGRLVPQKAEEGTARDLLKQIEAEKAKLIKDGKLKKEKPLPEITDEEKPFDIPESWCWCRLGEIVAFGQCQNAEPNEIQDNDWILDLEDIEKDSGKILAFKQKKDVDSKSTKHIFKKDYVLYSKLRPYLNKCVIAPQDGFCTSEILPLDFGDNIFNKYAQLYLMSPFFVDYTNSLSYGVKMPRLGTDDGKKALFPLPPLSEQKRIVAKLEEMLPLVEEYGNAQEELDTLNNEIPEKLKKAILQEAIQGKLVPQIASEGNAKDLLHKIETERKKSNPKYKPLPPVTDDEIPFDIPESWEWVKGRDLFETMKSVKPSGTTFKYIDIDSVDNKTNTYKAKVIPTTKAPSRATRHTQKGDVLFSMVRPYLRNITIVQEDDCIASTGFYVCRSLINSDFLLYLMLSSYVVEGLTNNCMKGDNSPSVNNGDIENYLFPLPPLAEQKRIVEKLEELLGVIDKMK